ncbi:hypothetical protein Q5H93_20310 [Hymenobacter sp. ASUV-10]|uniref:LVIVD repeat-containing protein n=1 Tax=Hymenobacter aranciens TaxID=3063996 RepID=A0ABT9BFQ3_9BACT|nr:hypothetical protein [Hymenobacter sp. ASUV-10]MDO7877100.1 hypothetical protein [Hymenobacter sp. ASUV-10]
MRQLYLFCLSLALAGCIGNADSISPVMSVSYVPRLMAREQLESAAVGLPPQALHHPGKIFISNRYLFVNEQYQGIHIFDNADPAHPKAVQFLRIPGNVDLAVRGSLLYADSGPDLVTFDISDPAQARVAGRTRNALPELSPPILGMPLPTAYQPANRPANTVIVGWDKR